MDRKELEPCTGNECDKSHDVAGQGQNRKHHNENYAPRRRPRTKVFSRQAEKIMVIAMKSSMT